MKCGVGIRLVVICVGVSWCWVGEVEFVLVDCWGEVCDGGFFVVVDDKFGGGIVCFEVRSDGVDCFF